jgi:hypothetical protein
MDNKSIKEMAMETINLTDAEATALHRVVKTHLSELRTEISYTDDRDYKAELKQNQETLQVVLLKLAAAESSSPAYPG